MIESSSFLTKVLMSFSWPKSTKETKNLTDVNKASLTSRFLQALSYSEHYVEGSSRKIIDNNVEIDKISIKLEKLWQLAQLSLRQKKFLRAERALLKIIEIDNLNAAAYNRLGILYAKSREYGESIRCFKLATKLEPAASSYHNLALISYETSDYRSALKYFQVALKYDDQYAPRYVALAKTYEKLGNEKKVISNLEIAAEIDPSKQTKELLYAAYRTYGFNNKALKTERQMLDSLKQDVQEVKRLERKITHDQNIFPSSTGISYQY